MLSSFCKVAKTDITGKLESLGYIFVADGMGLSSFKFLW